MQGCSEGFLGVFLSPVKGKCVVVAVCVDEYQRLIADV